MLPGVRPARPQFEEEEENPEEVARGEAPDPELDRPRVVILSSPKPLISQFSLGYEPFTNLFGVVLRASGHE